MCSLLALSPDSNKKVVLSLLILPSLENKRRISLLVSSLWIIHRSNKGTPRFFPVKPSPSTHSKCDLWQDSWSHDGFSCRDPSTLPSVGSCITKPTTQSLGKSFWHPTSQCFAAPAGFKTPQLQPDCVDLSNRQMQLGVHKQEHIQDDAAFKLMGFVALPGQGRANCWDAETEEATFARALQGFSYYSIRIKIMC